MSAIKETLAMLQPALDQGWELAGVIVGSGPGDADSWSEIGAFNEGLHVMARHWRAASGDGDLPIILMQPELLSPNKLNVDYVSRVKALRHEFAIAPHHLDHSTVALSNSHWHQVKANDAFHLDARSETIFGHSIANAIFDYQQGHPEIFVV
jgi:hypothetical protein